MHRLARLDLLRGVAAVIVVFYHWSIFFLPATVLGNPSLQHSGWEHLMYSSPLTILIGGNFAVHIFIIISGFVVSGSIIKHRSQPKHLQHLIARFIRLAGPVFLSAIICYCIFKSGLLYNEQAEPLTLSPWLSAHWNFLPHFLSAIWEGFAAMFSTNVVRINPVLWMINYIWYGTIGVYVLRWFIDRAIYRRLALVTLAILSVKTNFLGFWLGALMAEAWASDQNIRTWSKTQSWALLGISLLFGSAQIYLGDLSYWYQRILIPGLTADVSAQIFHVAGASLLVWTVLHWPTRSTSKIPAVWSWLGSRSFSIYLLHFVLLGSVACWLFIRLVAIWPYIPAAMVSLFLTVAIMIPVVELFYRYVDVGFQHLAHLLLARQPKKN